MPLLSQAAIKKKMYNGTSQSQSTNVVEFSYVRYLEIENRMVVRSWRRAIEFFDECGGTILKLKRSTLEDNIEIIPMWKFWVKMIKNALTTKMKMVTKWK